MQPGIIRSGRHDTVCNAILRALNNDGVVTLSRSEAVAVEKYSSKAEPLFTKLSENTYKINLDAVLKCSYVIGDRAWRSLSDQYCRRMALLKSRGEKVRTREQWQKRYHGYTSRRHKDSPVTGPNKRHDILTHQQRVAQTDELPDYKIIFSEEE